MDQTHHQGLVILFTGNGKGKTTAAMGILARAVGWQFAVGVIQFIKSGERLYGESLLAKTIGVPFESLGDGFVRHRNDKSEAKQAALQAWQKAQDWIIGNALDVLILDEITYLFHFEWLDVGEWIEWVRTNKPTRLHLILTGRYAPQKLIEFADLVTEMQEIKHPFRQKGLPAQKGIDF